MESEADGSAIVSEGTGKITIEGTAVNGGNHATSETVFTADNTRFAHWTFTGKGPDASSDSTPAAATTSTTGVIAKTGDSTPLALLFAVMLACAATLALVWRKKKLSR